MSSVPSKARERVLLPAHRSSGWKETRWRPRADRPGRSRDCKAEPWVIPLTDCQAPVKQRPVIRPCLVIHGFIISMIPGAMNEGNPAIYRNLIWHHARKERDLQSVKVDEV